MGNIAFIYRKDRTWFKRDAVTEALSRVCESRLRVYGAKVTLAGTGPEWEVHVGPHIMYLHSTGRRVGGKHPRGLGMDWVTCVVYEYLAQELGARLGDEGVAERWDPEPEKYSTPEKYAAGSVEHFEDPVFRVRLYNSKLREIYDLLSWTMV